ncbi:MAG TPA: 2-amino-4-hydroxy-6-hydroxymethyldihydropteridine diphosphokinase [bacterium]|nr:2-amino-4-hydroxy-6-hydroxymethyldihydropteridine diphosphokinase [bacterium]
MTSPAPVEAGIALGSNLGNPAKNVTHAIQRLARIPEIEVLRTSRLYRSEPWGDPDQAEFVNAAAVIATTKTARDLLRVLRDEEKTAGPREARRWGPRTLDLDLLWYGTEISADPDLTLPHPEMARRTFVLMPLMDIAPDWRHPRTDETPQEMLQALERSGKATRCVPLSGVPGGAQ